MTSTGNTAPIVRVYRPELTKEERARRMKAIEQAAVALIIADNKRRKERKA